MPTLALGVEHLADRWAPPSARPIRTRQLVFGFRMPRAGDAPLLVVSGRAALMVDVLMVTHARPSYTRLSLPRLLETCSDSVRVWIWHNGQDAETLEVVNSYLSHPRVHSFRHSAKNVGLCEPTNWLWENASGEYVAKVDDDCLVPNGWIETLASAHRDYDGFGAIGCWEFPDEDFLPELASRKIREFAATHKILQNLWIGGSGYLLKTRCVVQQGLLRRDESFPQYLFRLAEAGWIHGWYFPFLRQEHMDDPRSPHTLMKTDEDVRLRGGRMARYNGCTTIDEWERQIRRAAYVAQTAPLDVDHYRGWRRIYRAVQRRLRRFVGVKRQW